MEELCVITDIHLPAMSGFELVSTLRRRCPLVPVVFITAFDTPEQRNQARAFRGAAYLAKPFEAADLFDAIGKVMQYYRCISSNLRIADKITRLGDAVTELRNDE